MVVALGKCDLPEATEAYDEVANAMKERGHEVHRLSGASREGCDELLLTLERVLTEHQRPGVTRAEPLPSRPRRPHGDATGFPTLESPVPEE